MQKIDVVLLQDHKTLGKKYSVVGVKPVYARNVLFPQGIARFADKGTLNDLKAKMESSEKNQKILIEKIKTLLHTLESTETVFVSEVNEHGKLYGNIHAKDIAAKLTADHGLEVSPDYLKIKDIEEVGEYTVKFNGEGIQGSFQVKVSSK